MPDVNHFYERNDAYAQTFDQGDLGMMPRLATVVLTCVDSRLDPGRFLGLELGDAMVLRTAGARVTDTAVTEVAMIYHLLTLGAGGTPPQLGLMVIGHTDCGMERFADPAAAAAVTEAFGTDEVVNTYAIADPDEAIRGDVAKARAGLPAGVRVSGHIYDVRSGRLRGIIAADD